MKFLVRSYNNSYSCHIESTDIQSALSLLCSRYGIIVKKVNEDWYMIRNETDTKMIISSCQFDAMNQAIAIFTDRYVVPE